jgi:PKD domain-containing protein
LAAQSNHRPKDFSIATRPGTRAEAKIPVCNRENYEARFQRAIPFFDRLHTRTILVIATMALLVLASGLAFSGHGRLALAARQSPSVLQQKPASSKAQTPPGRTDKKSVLTTPGISSIAPQRPSFKLTSVPQSVRILETVKLSLAPPELVRRQSSFLGIDFGDGKLGRLDEDNNTAASHWYSPEQPQRDHYDVKVYSLEAPQGPGLSNRVQVVPWTLSPVPQKEIEIGDEVHFNIVNPPAGQSIQYWFHFDEDDSPEAKWTSDAKVKHRYHSPGPHKPYAEVRRVIDGSTVATPTAPLQINVKQLADTALLLTSVPNNTVQAEKDVKFTATFGPKLGNDDSHIRYRFDFGDKIQSEWQVSSESTHRYSLVGAHLAQVEVGWEYEQSKTPRPIATSKPPHQIEVTAIPVASWWQRLSRDLKPYSTIIIPALVVIALAILFAGYQTLKGRVSVRPDYRAHRDLGIALTTGRSVAIDFDIRLKPDVTEAQYQLDAPEAGLIRYERRVHE